MGRNCTTHRRIKCPDCGRRISSGWMSRHRCDKKLTSSLKQLTLEERMEQIQYCLIRAKVDMEYGMVGRVNTHLIEAKKEIEKAIDYAFVKEDEI